MMGYKSLQLMMSSYLKMMKYMFDIWWFVQPQPGFCNLWTVPYSPYNHRWIGGVSEHSECSLNLFKISLREEKLLATIETLSDVCLYECVRLERAPPNQHSLPSQTFANKALRVGYGRWLMKYNVYHCFASYICDGNKYSRYLATNVISLKM